MTPRVGVDLGAGVGHVAHAAQHLGHELGVPTRETRLQVRAQPIETDLLTQLSCGAHTQQGLGRHELGAHLQSTAGGQAQTGTAGQPPGR
jgi:hypothetical protein